MKEIISKLQAIERKLAKRNRNFWLFGLFLREDSPGTWDLLVAAPWIAKNKRKALGLISAEVSRALDSKEILQLSRVVLIDGNHPALRALSGTLKVEGGVAEVRDCNFSGLQIRHAYILTCHVPKSKRVTPEPSTL